MSAKERVVFLDRAAFIADELPIPRFDHNWSEYPDTEAADLVPRLFWATTAITHACPIDANMIGQLHKLKRIVVTGPASVDFASCDARGIAVRQLAPGSALVELLENMVAERPHQVDRLHRMKLADPTLLRHPAVIDGTGKGAGFSIHNPASGKIGYAAGFIKWFAAMAQRNLGGLAQAAAAARPTE